MGDELVLGAGDAIEKEFDEEYDEGDGRCVTIDSNHSFK